LLVAGGWRLEAGSWRLVAGGWWLEAGGWRLVAGGWKLEDGWRFVAGSWRLNQGVDQTKSLLFLLLLGLSGVGPLQNNCIKKKIFK
jgi:hypothetical protein